MSRGNIKGVPIGLHGDKTTTGAVCISSMQKIQHGGRGVLRDTDVTTPCPECGKTGVIVESVSYYRVHGLGVAINGAKIHCGCPDGSNRLIAPREESYGPTVNSASATANAVSGQSTSTSSSAQPAFSTVTSHSVAPSQSSFSPTSCPASASSPIPVPSLAELSRVVKPACDCPDQMEALASYIADEMNRNIYHPSVLEMKALDSYNFETEYKIDEYLALPRVMRLWKPAFYSTAIRKKATAFILWTERVGQDRDWDHKPILRAKFKGIRHKQGQYDYFYDIWSNIHYGYVGMAGGLSESVLLDGAGAEQIVSDVWRKIEEMWDKPSEEWERLGPHPTASPWTSLRSWDDVADRVSVSIGVKLYKLYPGGITAKTIMNEVLAVEPKNWGAGVEKHKCRR